MSVTVDASQVLVKARKSSNTGAHHMFSGSDEVGLKLFCHALALARINTDGERKPYQNVMLILPFSVASV